MPKLALITVSGHTYPELQGWPMFGLFGKKTAPAVQKADAQRKNGFPSLPTVKAAPEMFDCYADVFRSEMSTVKPFDKKQIEAMLAFIESGEGGFLNMGHYHQTIFDKYFKGRAWSWPEYEKWQTIFTKHGSAPINWPNYPDGESPYGFHLYGLLMRFMNFRAKAIHDQKRRSDLGIKSTLLIVHDQDKPFIEMALMMNPDTLPPFFPTDATVSTADTKAMLGK